MTYEELEELRRLNARKIADLYVDADRKGKDLERAYEDLKAVAARMGKVVTVIDGNITLIDKTSVT